MQRTGGTFTFEPDVHYIIDMNAALNFPEFFDPKANLPERHIIISRAYQKGLYKLRDESSDRGIAANELANLLHQLITEGEQEKNDGAYEYHLGNLHVIIDFNHHAYEGQELAGDHIKDAISLARYWKNQFSTVKKVVILTNDPLMQISTQNLDLEIVMFSPAPYIGYRRINNEDLITYWRKMKHGIPAKTFYDYLPDAEPLKPHEFVLFGKTNGFGHIGRYSAANEMIVPLTYFRNIQGITPIGELQAMAFEALLAPADEISVVILYGNAGAGKTFAAISSAISQSGLANAKTLDAPPEQPTNGKQVRQNGKRARKQRQQSALGADWDSPLILGQFDEETSTTARRSTTFSLPPHDTAVDYPYQSIMVCPPDRMLGDKMAAVPGDERAKLASKLNAYLDNIRAFLRSRKDKKEGGITPNERDIAIRALNIMNKIEICPPGEINGRSFWNTFFICDEAQFNSLAQIKACIERCDNGTKLALCGDPSQISNPFGWHGNPLARAVRFLSNDPSVAIIRFDGESEIKRPGAQIVARSWPR